MNVNTNAYDTLIGVGILFGGAMFHFRCSFNKNRCQSYIMERKFKIEKRGILWQTKTTIN